MAIHITCEAGIASPTLTGVKRALDVSFTLTYMPEAERGQGKPLVRLEGEVTLLPREDGSPGHSSWGQIDHWLDGASVKHLLDLDETERAELIDAILSATSEACDDYTD